MSPTASIDCIYGIFDRPEYFKTYQNEHISLMNVHSYDCGIQTNIYKPIHYTHDITRALSHKERQFSYYFVSL